MKSALEIKNLTVEFDGLKVLDGLYLQINEGDVVALIGPNGAGKSTVLKSVMGLVEKKTGTVEVFGVAIHPSPERMVRAGIIYVSQDQKIFSNLKVRDNLDVVAYILKSPREIESQREMVLQLFPVLQKKLNERAGQLSGGEQQMLAVARGLMLSPKILLLDEPSLGLSPKVAKELFSKLDEIRQKFNITMVVVEHNLKLLTLLVERILFLDNGKVAREFSANELRDEKTIIKYAQSLI